MKNSTTAYILYFIGGVLGFHKFYLKRTGMGFAYMFTLGLFGFGLFYDLFTLRSQVKDANRDIELETIRVATLSNIKSNNQ